MRQDPNEKKPYRQPVSDMIPIRTEWNICSNPLPGGIEDIGYDDDDD